MATSVAEIQAAVGTACQALKGIVTSFQKAIERLEGQIEGNEQNLDKLRAQTNPDQNTINQIKLIEQTLTTLRDQISQQYANLAAAQADYESYCPSST
jgi:predicted  nucleic acid-binding Zn-ribbon protein